MYLKLLLTKEHWEFTKAADHPTDMDFVDFSKASDKVLHGHLLEKLRALGVGGLLVRWIRDFRTGRSVNQSLSVTQT